MESLIDNAVFKVVFLERYVLTKGISMYSLLYIA